MIETYAFYFEVEANNRVEAEEKAKEYVDKYQADKFFECATNRVFKIIPKAEGDKMKIKAYAWDDEDYGGSYFVWTTTPGKAKALLAAEHDREFTEIRVYRVPWADKYGDNK